MQAVFFEDFRKAFDRDALREGDALDLLAEIRSGLQFVDQRLVIKVRLKVERACREVLHLGCKRAIQGEKLRLFNGVALVQNVASSSAVTSSGIVTVTVDSIRSTAKKSLERRSDTRKPSGKRARIMASQVSVKMRLFFRAFTLLRFRCAFASLRSACSFRAFRAPGGCALCGFVNASVRFRLRDGVQLLFRQLSPES